MQHSLVHRSLISSHGYQISVNLRWGAGSSSRSRCALLHICAIFEEWTTRNLQISACGAQVTLNGPKGEPHALDTIPLDPKDPVAFKVRGWGMAAFSLAVPGSASCFSNDEGRMVSAV